MKKLEGKKRLIGFYMWLLGYVIAGLATASGMLPEYPVIAQVHDALVLVQDALNAIVQQLGFEDLTQAGLVAMVIGVGDAAVREFDSKAS